MRNDDDYRKKTRAAAAHLGCRATDDSIVAACEALADQVVDSIDPGLEPAHRLVALADRYSVDLHVAYSTEQLDHYVHSLATKGELGFATRRPRFDHDLLAAVMRRRARAAGDRTFVAVIDGRGQRKAMAFFSSTHEVAHPLLEPQLAFDFREEVVDKDRWETLVDRVGAAIVFRGEPWNRAVRSAAASEPGLTMATLRDLREQMARDASLTAVALAAANTLGRAMLVVIAKPLTSKRDPVPTLRISRVIPNKRAADAGVYIHEKRRIPASSPIARAIASSRAQHGLEDLSAWVDSSGRGLPASTVWTAAFPLPDGSAFGLIDLDAAR